MGLGTKVLAKTIVVLPLVAAVGYLVTPPSQGCACKIEWTAMKVHLRNLVTAEGAFFSDSARYIQDLAGLQFTIGTDVSVTVEAMSRRGYRARARWVADSATALRVGDCVLWLGDSSFALADVPEFEPRCQRPRRPRWRYGAYGPPQWER